MDLAALEEGDRLTVADHGDHKLGQAGVTAIPQRERAAPCFEESVLVAHGTQGPTGRVLLQGCAEGLRALVGLEHDDALPIGGNERRVHPEEPPSDVEQAPQAGHRRDLVEGVHATTGTVAGAKGPASGKARGWLNPFTERLNGCRTPAIAGIQWGTLST